MMRDSLIPSFTPFGILFACCSAFSCASLAQDSSITLPMASTVTSELPPRQVTPIQGTPIPTSVSAIAIPATTPPASTTSVTGGEPVPLVDPDQVKIDAIVRQMLALLPADRHFKELLAQSTARAYADRGFRPIWDGGKILPSFHQELAEALQKHALPERLAIDPAELLPLITDRTVDPRDLAHTTAFMDAALHVRLGAVPTEKIWSEWNKEDAPGGDDRSVPAIVQDLVAASVRQPFTVEAAIDTMGPQNWVYRELLKALPESTQAILKYSGLPNIPDPTHLGAGKPGESHPAAPAIAAHLIDKGYLALPPAMANSITSMTPELVAALVAFQKDHGLDPDGIFGPGSWRYLNSNAADRFRLLHLNLHRARLLPNKMGGRYLLVNVPAAEMHAFDDHDFHTLSMRVVVGKAGKQSHETVMFRDIMQEIEFAPYWNVPRSIAVSELLPKIREDWDYMNRNNYEIVSATSPNNGNSYRISPEVLDQVSRGSLIIRQRPGSDNALGNVKFLFPNRYNIYMHDTPAKNFFARAQRDFSHGCIRVEDPAALGAWLLGPEGWDQDRVKATMNGGRRRNHAVKHKVNVYLAYFTLFPRPAAGRTVLAPAADIYQRDSADAKTLQAFLPWQEQ